jgi:hypothetical protein
LGGALTGFLLLRFGDRWGIFPVLERFWFWLRYRPRRQSPSPNPSGSLTYSRLPPEEVLLYFEGEPITQSDIDAILDKIAALGYQSLSERERRILYEASRRMNAEP